MRQFHVTLPAGNGRTIASETDNTRAAALIGVESIRKNAGAVSLNDRSR